MSQQIHGNVGQVAAGDIYNFGLDELALLNESQLRVGLAHCQERLSNVRRRMIFNPVVAWFLVAVIAFGLLVVTGLAFSHSMVLWGLLMIGLVAPRFFYIPIARKYGPMVQAYRAGISRIEFVLHSRGCD